MKMKLTWKRSVSYTHLDVYKRQEEYRYFISSLREDIELISRAVRGHGTDLDQRAGPNQDGGKQRGFPHLRYDFGGAFLR